LQDCEVTEHHICSILNKYSLTIDVWDKHGPVNIHLLIKLIKINVAWYESLHICFKTSTSTDTATYDDDDDDDNSSNNDNDNNKNKIPTMKLVHTLVMLFHAMFNIFVRELYKSNWWWEM